jgi:hypothetical protein
MRQLHCILLLAALTGGCSSQSPSTPVAPTPPATVNPPAEIPPAPVARLAVTVDGLQGSAAISGASVVRFDATGSSGTGLRFGLDFGDGQGADLATATHIYQDANTTRRARVIVTDSLGRVDQASIEVVLKTISGTWTNTVYNENARRYEFRRLYITQLTGPSVIGEYMHPEGWTTPITGQVLARGATVNLTDGTITFSSDASNGFNSDLSAVSMRVRGGSADGLVLTFSRSANY